MHSISSKEEALAIENCWGKQTSLLKIILYFIGGGGHKHSDGQRNEITESSNTERTNEELIQSRSIDHLLCGGDGNKPRYKNLVKLLVSKNNNNNE